MTTHLIQFASLSPTMEVPAFPGRCNTTLPGAFSPRVPSTSSHASASRLFRNSAQSCVSDFQYSQRRGGFVGTMPGAARSEQLSEIDMMAR